MEDFHVVGHLEVAGVRYDLPDGRVLLDNASFRVGEGAIAALVGAGAVTRSGGLGVMHQMVGADLNPDATVSDLLLSVAPARIRAAARTVDGCEQALMESDDEGPQMRYATSLAEYADAGGYDIEVTWDVCTTSALHLPYGRVKYRLLGTLSGGEQKRLVLNYLLHGPEEVLLLDEPDNFLDVPGKIWLEGEIKQSPKTILFVSHDRELLNRTATQIVTVELGASGNLVWTHPGGFATYEEARRARFARFDEQRRRWDEQHAKLRAQMLMYKQKAAYNSDMASRYQAATTRLRKFEEAGPPSEQPREQHVVMRLTGGRTGKRAVVCEQLQLTGLTASFDLEVWFGERVAVLGSNGSGKSHFLRLLARGGTHADLEHRPVGEVQIEPVAHDGVARLGARVRPGWFVQTHAHPELSGRNLLEILHRGDTHRQGMGREEATRALGRYELAHAAEQTFDSLSGGQQARFQILLLELRSHPAAARRAHGQPGCSVGRSTRSWARRLPRHRHSSHPRPLVRARLRPVPRVRRERVGLRVGRTRVGRRQDRPCECQVSSAPQDH